MVFLLSSMFAASSPKQHFELSVDVLWCCCPPRWTINCAVFLHEISQQWQHQQDDLQSAARHEKARDKQGY